MAANDFSYADVSSGLSRKAHCGLPRSGSTKPVKMIEKDNVDIAVLPLHASLTEQQVFAVYPH